MADRINLNQVFEKCSTCCFGNKPLCNVEGCGSVLLKDPKLKEWQLYRKEWNEKKDENGNYIYD